MQYCPLCAPRRELRLGDELLAVAWVQDVKPDNVLVNYGHGDIRFSDVKLGDCGSTVHRDSGHAKDGDVIRAPIFRSPEAQLRLPWDLLQTSGPLA